MSKVVNIDSADIDRILNSLNEENRKEAIFKSITKAGQKLVKETKQELLKVLPNANRGKRYEGRPMIKGVRLVKDKAYEEVKVHIMGDYRLRFFEMGTEERYLKKPLKKDHAKYNFNSGKTNSGGNPYRGKITPRKFFQTARENSDMVDVMMKTLNKEINKLLE